MGPYLLQASVACEHARGSDWGRILWLYDRMYELSPTAVVALNRAVALAEVSGPEAALDALDGLDLDAYHLFHATRADLLRRLDRVDEAAGAYRAALERTESDVEREFLQRRLDAL
jgi:RNA polymerase sigma-70 factor (ECF subfamily)